METQSGYKNIYFVGIGGIGMSALARYFKSTGCSVAGYDKTPSEVTDALSSEGIAIHFEDSTDKIPDEFKNMADTLVVYTPAIPKDHSELNYFRKNGFEVEKRSEVLGKLTEGKKTIAVAGTHGKTSTSTIISHLLKTAGIPFYSFLGGISVNYRTNFLKPENGNADIIVVEADEFDRSFLRLNPDVAVITAIESDHLDIYGTLDELKTAYYEFARKLKPGGTLVTQENIIIGKPQNGNHYTYSALDKATFFAENIQVEDERFYFDLVRKTGDRANRLNRLEMGAPGIHNIENALAAIAATEELNISPEVIRSALESYHGVHRRFEIIINKGPKILIDDYAHHPTEINATINTVRNLYPGKKVLGIFQPHLYTRTRDLASGFADSLSKLDEVILLPIYPAREEPIEGISSVMILENITLGQKQILEKEELLNHIDTTDADVIVTIGAGDIDRLVGKIKERLS